MKSPVVIGSCLWIVGYAAAVLLPRIEMPLYGPAAFVILLVLLRFGSFQGKNAVSWLLVILLAFSYYQWADGRNDSQIVFPGISEEILDGKEIQVMGILNSPVSVDGDKASFVLKAEQVEGTGPEMPAIRIREKLQVTVKLLKQEEQQVMVDKKRGDRLEFSGVLEKSDSAGNFGGFDYRRYLRLQHVHWMVSVKGTDHMQTSSGNPWQPVYWLRWNDWARDKLSSRLDEIFPAGQGGYMKGLLIGVRSDLDPESYREFSELGLTHILAISGMHVAVFIGVLLWIFRVAGMTRENGQLAAMWLLPFYVLLTGASPSVIRAGIMAFIALFAARKRLLHDGLHMLCAAAVLMLLWNPYYLLDVGFQLSYLVTLGLIILVPPVGRLLPVRRKSWNTTLAVTFVAQAVSFPLSVYYFNQFSLISWFANLLLVPLISLVVTPLGSIALGLSFVSFTVGRWTAWATAVLNDFSFSIVSYLDGWRIFHLIWPTPTIPWILAYFGLMILFVMGMDKRRKSGREEGPFLLEKVPLVTRLPILALCTVLFAGLLFYGYRPDRFRHVGTVNFLNVGQGDSILIHTPEGKNLLVDGGGSVTFSRKPEDRWKERSNPYDVGVKLLVPLLKKRGVHELDELMVTHEDDDHLGGLIAVIEQIPVRRIIFNGTIKRSKNTDKLFRLAMEKKIPLLAAGAGCRIQADASTLLYFLEPFSEGRKGELIRAEEQNGKSLVFLMRMGGFQFLFTGDMEKKEEAELLQKMAAQEWTPERAGLGLTSAIDVLKIAHHGSNTSTTAEWVAFWQPKAAVISVGENNRYGHPHVKVVSRLQDSGVEIYRTDTQGEVRITVGKGRMQIETKGR